MTEETKQTAHNLVGKLRKNADNVCVALQPASHTSHTDNDAVLRVYLKDILMDLCIVADMMEDFQRTRAINIVSYAFQHLQIMKDTDSLFRFKEKVIEMVEDMKAVVTVAKKRAEIIEYDNDVLLNAANEIEICTPELAKATKAVLDTGTQAAVDTQQTYIRRMAVAFSKIFEILQEKRAAVCTFDFAAFSDTLDRLQSALQQCHIDNAVSEAKRAALTLQNNPEYCDNHVSVLLKNVLQLTKAQIQNPVVGQHGELADAIVELKREGGGVHVRKAGQGEAKQMRETLIECARSLSDGLGLLATTTQTTM